MSPLPGLIMPAAIMRPPAGGPPVDAPTARSLRFNSADSANLTRTNGVPTAALKWTLSWWEKRSELSVPHSIFGATGTNNTCFTYAVTNGNTAGDAFNFQLTTPNTRPHRTTALYRDPAAFVHCVVAYDSANATAANRVQYYRNNILQTSPVATLTLNQSSAFNENAATFKIGLGTAAIGGVSDYFDGYMAEVAFIDGQALTPSSFGAADATTGIWGKIDLAGLTFGNNGFWLKFTDNSNITAATLGKDYSGNANNFTPNNFSVTAGVGNDSLTDVPTNGGTDTGVGGEVRGNFATLNPLNVGFGISGTGALKNGLLDWTVTGTGTKAWLATMALTAGKFYCENTITAVGAGAGLGLVAEVDLPLTTNAAGVGAGPKGWVRQAAVIWHNNSSAAFGSAITTGDVVMMAVDIPGGKGWFGRNGAWEGSGNPAAGANPAFTFTPGSDAWYIAAQGIDTVAGTINFGQRPYTYAAPSGFKTICTQNLADPAIIVPTSCLDGLQWTGNDADPRSITPVGFQPDLVWVKKRSGSNLRDHVLVDAVRGPLLGLATNLSIAENNQGPNTRGTVKSFLSNGFTIGSGDTDAVNAVTNTYTSWAWKKGAPQGVEIVAYTGDGTTNRNIAHALGVAPKFAFIKSRATGAWYIWHQNLASVAHYLTFSTAMPVNTTSPFGTGNWSATQFMVSANTISLNASAVNYIAYLFSEVPGFSRFGFYTGKADVDGPFLWCGFRPRLIFTKKVDGAVTSANWGMLDALPNPDNPATQYLLTDTTAMEAAGTAAAGLFLDILSNGFKLRGTGIPQNDAQSYIFAAFAQHPFKYGRAR